MNNRNLSHHAHRADTPTEYTDAYDAQQRADLEDKFYVYEYTIAGHFLSALINADKSGLCDEDEAHLGLFLLTQKEYSRAGHWDVVGEGDHDAFFAKCDICGLKAYCFDVLYLVKK